MVQSKLTPKQENFVEEYLVDLNATQAAIRAGYSKKTAGIIGHENLRKPKIQAVLQSRRDELMKSTKMDQQWVLERYKKLASYKITDFFDDEYNLKPLSEIPEDAIFAIQGLDVDTKTIGKDIKSFIQKFKLSDKKAALDSIARHLGFFERDNDQATDKIVIHVDGRVDKTKGANGSTGRKQSSI